MVKISEEKLGVKFPPGSTDETNKWLRELHNVECGEAETNARLLEKVD
jgi:hypothetical protein